MIITICNGCGRRIADDDAGAAHRIQLAPGELVDWCGGCVAIVRAELPRLAAEAKAAQRVPMQQRAMRIWEPRSHAVLPYDATTLDKA